MGARVLVATLLCDRKSYSQLWAVKRNAELTYPDKTLYVCVETREPERFRPLQEFLAGSGVPYQLDYWEHVSTWRRPPQFDQDQARLTPIVLGRELARYAAMLGHYAYILYVDADVIVPKDSIERLIATGKPLVGGLVPGRGEHRHVHYLSKYQRRVEDLLEVDYATAGFLLVRRDVFLNVAWRWGTAKETGGRWIAEDPLYGRDAREAGFGRWYVREDLVAEHWDDPEHPLKDKEAAQF